MIVFSFRHLATIVFAVVGCLATNGFALGQNTSQIRVGNSEELRRVAQRARPGTTILLAPGTYRGGITLAGLAGKKDLPIVIAGADPKRRPVIQGGNSCMHLTDPAHVVLRDLVLTGARVNGLNIDDGGSYDSPAHHVTLQRLHVHNVGSNGNHDGIKLSGLDHFRIDDCTVERWGKKGSAIDMVGCHQGLVIGSTIRDGDRMFGSGVQMKGGSRDVVVSRCHFENAGGRAVNVGGSTGLPYFRPKPQGYEAKDLTVSDCTFIGSMAPVAFVGVDGANVHHNTIYRPTRWVMRILQENQHEDFVACRNGRFTNNVIVFRAGELVYPANVGPGTSADSFRFSDNLWYCQNRPQDTMRLVKLPAKEQNSVYGRDPNLADPRNGDLRLSAGSMQRFGARSKGGTAREASPK